MKEKFKQVICPDEIDFDAAKAELQGEEIVIVEDEDLANDVLDAFENKKVQKILDLILKRVACDEVISSAKATEKLKTKAQTLKTAINQELVDLLNL